MRDTPRRVEAIILKADEPSPAGRVYSEKALASAIVAYQERLRDPHGNFGMFNEGDSDFFEPDVNKICMQIKRVEMKDSQVVVEALILDTPAGKKVAEMLRKGQAAFYTTGTGTVKKGAMGLGVVSDFSLSSINVIAASEVPGGQVIKVLDSVCAECFGSGHDADGNVCWVCDGEGVIKVEEKG